jgi:membrane-anchored protein YejM (alkaline phosphatase superfamily)
MRGKNWLIKLLIANLFVFLIVIVAMVLTALKGNLHFTVLSAVVAVIVVIIDTIIYRRYGIHLGPED